MESEQKIEYFYAISDIQGLIGVFTSKNAIFNISNEYNSINFLVQRFKVFPGSIDFVWSVLYKTSDAVAYVSNNKEDAIRAQTMLNKVSLCYDDNIDYWKIPINSIHEDKKKRLDVSKKAISLAEIELDQINQIDLFDDSILDEKLDETSSEQSNVHNRLLMISYIN